MEKKCSACQLEPIACEFSHLNLGHQCALKYGIKSHVVTHKVHNNLSSLSHNEEAKFTNMFHGLSMDPHVSLKLLEKTFHSQVSELTTSLPFLKNRTFVDTLTAANLDQIKSLPQVMQARQAALNIVHILHKNFTLFIQDKLHEGLTLAEAQICGIKEFLKINSYQSLTFNEIYTQGEVTQDQVNRVINAFQVACSLVPDKYKQNTPLPTIIIRGEGSLNTAPFASAAQKSIIGLNIQKDLIVQIAEALHEYLHLIEQFNPEINLATNKFLLSKANSLTMASLEILGTKYQKPFKMSAKDIKVYEGPFIDLYVGRTYGELDPNLKTLVTTEVLSVGIEALLLNPTNFYMRDPEHFNLISKVLRGEI